MTCRSFGLYFSCSGVDGVAVRLSCSSLAPCLLISARIEIRAYLPSAVEPMCCTKY